MTEGLAVSGETLTVSERMIVSPGAGVFRPLSAELDLTDTGEEISAGQAIGVVEGPGASTTVRSPFAGSLIGMLARAGERVREGQPVAWLRLA